MGSPNLFYLVARELTKDTVHVLDAMRAEVLTFVVSNVDSPCALRIAAPLLGDLSKQVREDIDR